MAPDLHFFLLLLPQKLMPLVFSAVHVISTMLAGLSMDGRLCLQRLSFSICTFSIQRHLHM